MKPMMVAAKKELLKELIKSMQAKMLEDQEPEAPKCCEEVECDCAEEADVAPEAEDEGIDVMEVLQGKKPVKPKVKVTIAALGSKLSQMKPPFKKK